MKGKLIIISVTILLSVFFHYFNGNKIVQYTKEMSTLEKTVNAESNINTELLVELDDMRSGRHISSLVTVELNNFISDTKKGVIYVHEPSSKQDKSNYCIIDLFASRAEAKTISVILD